MSYNTISFIGLGYIGLPTATLVASHMRTVIGVDVNEDVVTTVNAGKLHIVEPGLADVLKHAVENGQLRATQIPEVADVFVIAVPTPFTAQHKPDVSCIKAAALSIAPILRKGNLVILESTSPVGTTEQMAKWLAEVRPDLSFPQQAGDEADVQIAYCPERILPGKMLEELVSNDRVVGGLSPKASRMAVEFYKIFVKGEITATTARTAELCKLTENSFRDVNIAFANELSMICDKLDIDVWELIKLANRHPRVNILQPGCGVGGHCIAVDPWFIVDSTPEEARLIRTAREVNDHKPQWVLEKVKLAIADVLSKNPDKTIKDVTVACLGLAFKPDIDDLRESPAVEITYNIAMLGCVVLVVEPYVEHLPPALNLDNISFVSIENAIEKSNIYCTFTKHSVLINHFADISNNTHVIDAAGFLSV